MSTGRQLPAILAKVRWRREPRYGLLFDQTFQFEELAALMERLQLAG
jgi:hypothetical protein